MNTTCTYNGNRDEMLIAYLYDDGADNEAADRDAYERHLASCAACRRELAELGDVRERLSHWSPPEPAFGVGRAAAPGAEIGRILSGPPRWFNRIGEIPVWAQVAVAALVVGVSAGAANLRITYDDSGFSVRTGWMQAPVMPAGASASARGTTSALAGQIGAQNQPAPWRADLAALEAELRIEMRASAAAPETRAASARDGEAADTIRRVRALIDESEKRQQRELALRVAEIANDARALRVADLRNIDRNLNVMQSNTGVDMMRLYRMTNDLAVRVGQVR